MPLGAQYAESLEMMAGLTKRNTHQQMIKIKDAELNTFVEEFDLVGIGKSCDDVAEAPG